MRVPLRGGARLIPASGGSPEARSIRAGEEILHAARAEGPEHVRPIVRHRVLALATDAGLLHLRPVMVRAPHRAAGEARFVGDGAGGEMAAERNAGHADALRIDRGLLLEPVDRAARPAFRMRIDRQTLQAQRLAAARLVDAQRGHAAPGERLG